MRVIALLLATLPLGCAANDSLLERGEPIDSGRRRFDAYFAEVAELRDKVKELDSDLFPVRQPLTEELEVDVDASLPALMSAAKKRAEKFKSFGVMLNLRITPNPIVVVQQGELAQDEKDDGLLKAVQESATRALATYREYNQLIAVAQQLEQQRNELSEDIDKLPPEFDKRDLIETEIVAAGRVLESAENKLARDTRTLALFLVALADSIDTGAAEARDASCDEALAKYRPRKPWRGKGGRPAGGGKPPPRPPPKPSGGDFDM